MNDKDKSLSAIMEELAKSVANITTAQMALEYHNAKDNVKDGVNKLRTYCEKSAKDFGIDLNNASEKYDSARAKVKAIEEEYKKAMEQLQKDYEQRSEENNNNIVGYEGKKAAHLESLAVFKKAKKRYISMNEPDLADILEPYDSRLADYESEILTACKAHDYDKVKELSEKCEKIEAKKAEIESKVEGSYKEKLDRYDSRIKGSKEGHKACETKIKELKELSKTMKKEFEDQCKALEEERTKALRKVENNKLFDRIKGFFAKNTFIGANKLKSFEKNFIEPLGKQVSDFTKSVPGRIETARENFATKVREIINDGKDLAKDAVTKAGQIKEAAIDMTVEKAGQAKDAVVGAGRAAVEKAGQAKDAVVGAAVGVGNAVSEKATQAKEAVVGVGRAAVEKAGQAKDAVVEAAVGVGNAVSEKATQAKEAVVGAGVAVAGVAVGAVVGTGKAVVGIGERIKSSYTKGKESVLNGIDGIKGGIADGLDHVSDIMQEKINANNTRAAKIREDIANRQKLAKDKEAGEKE